MIPYPHSMTDEIAFELGRFDFPCFYDSAVWKPNLEDFKYANFFRWRAGMGLFCVLDSNPHTFSGDLDESKFTTLQYKLKYIQGRLKSYSVNITDSSIYIGYANSYKSRDRVAQWAHEILKERFGGKKTWEIKTGETPLSCPGTPYLRIEADKEIIDYLVKG